jgi:tetratricopeptide (TPR) repeat protein
MRSTLACMVLCCVAAGASAATSPTLMPVSTSSPQAHQFFERGMNSLENLRTNSALQSWREAVQRDPNLAIAHLLISYVSADPAEQTRECARARRLAGRVSPGEHLMILWLTRAQENDQLRAIESMNDLLAMFPRDKRLLFIAGRWLIQQQSYTHGEQLLERAIALDPNYPAALNELGYAYAYTRDFDRATEVMNKYVGLVPDEPNPHDSYAEVMRLAGNFEIALRHYHAALKLDPTFYWSQVGLADTYSLMGDEPRARQEYAVAVGEAKTQAEKVDYLTQSALTWVREADHAATDRALNAVAQRAHTAHLGKQEAEAYRIMAVAEPGPGGALEHLRQAEAVLRSHTNLSRTDRQEELARVLRLRVVDAQAAGDRKLAGNTLRQLNAMARGSRSNIIQRSYHAAHGALLLANGLYAEAIPELEEDSSDPLSLRLLIQAETKLGHTREAEDLRERLAQLNEPTVEQAVVVPRVRAELAQNRGN